MWQINTPKKGWVTLFGGLDIGILRIPIFIAVLQGS
jgi:hypothetical protein